MSKKEIPSDSGRRLLHPKLTVLVACRKENETPNIITLAWATPVSFDPPLITISVGKNRYSHDLISTSGEFVVNIPTKKLLEEVSFCGSQSGATTDKFEETGLTPEDPVEVEAPRIAECVAHLECTVEEEFEAGDHTIFLGRIASSSVEETIFDEESNVFDMESFEPIFHVGGPEFVTSGEGIP